jgi:hypothetical protein
MQQQLRILEATAPLPRAPLPLQLAEVPLIQVWGVAPRPNEGGTLPEHYWKTDREITGPDGERYQISVRGDAEYGLPFGNDGLYLLALLSLAREQAAWDGVIRDVSVREIVRRVRPGGEVGGDDSRAIRDALTRLLRTTVTLRKLREIAAPERAALPAPKGRKGGAPERSGRPAVPDAALSLPVEVRERGVPILNFDITQIQHGEREVLRTFINEVRIEPTWIDIAAEGWLTWLDLPLYSGLVHTAARNLYALLAARASRGHFATPQMTWSTDVAELAAQLGLAEGQKGRRLADSIERAGATLERAGILAGYEVVPGEKRGRYVAHFHPGERLLEVDRLRGTALFDHDDARRIFARLVGYGISRPHARGLVETKRNQALLWVLYMMYLEEHPDRAGKSIGSIGSYLYQAIRSDYSIPDMDRFGQWLAERGEQASRRITEGEPLSLPAPRGTDTGAPGAASPGGHAAGGSGALRGKTASGNAKAGAAARPSGAGGSRRGGGGLERAAFDVPGSSAEGAGATGAGDRTGEMDQAGAAPSAPQGALGEAGADPEVSLSEDSHASGALARLGRVSRVDEEALALFAALREACSGVALLGSHFQGLEAARIEDETLVIACPPAREFSAEWLARHAQVRERLQTLSEGRVVRLTADRRAGELPGEALREAEE